MREVIWGKETLVGGGWQVMGSGRKGKEPD